MEKHSSTSNTDRIATYRMWLAQQVAVYERGDMMTIAEAMHGAAAYTEALRAFDRVFKRDQQ